MHEGLAEQTHVKILLLVSRLVKIDLQSCSNWTWSHSDRCWWRSTIEDSRVGGAKNAGYANFAKKSSCVNFSRETGGVLCTSRRGNGSG